MGKAYALIVFLSMAAAAKGQLYYPPWPAFGIVAPADQDGGSATDTTTSVARLRHKLVAKAVAAFARAARLSKTGAWHQSVQELKKAVAIDPEFSEAHGNLGADYVRLGRFEDAAGELREAIRLDPTTGRHHANLAIDLTLMGRPDEAETEARTAVAIDAANFRAQYVLGTLLARKSETRAEAIPHLMYAARFMPEGHQFLAEVYRVSGEPKLAQAEAERYHAIEARAAKRASGAAVPADGFALSPK